MAGGDGVPIPVRDPDREDRGETAVQDVAVDIDGKVLDHLLVEPELLEDGVRDFVFIELVT